MVVVNKGNIYVPGDPKTTLDQVLGDYASLLREAGVDNAAIQPGTEPYLRAVSTVTAIGALFNNIAISADNTSELTATGDQLDAIRIAMGLPEVNAAPAGGNLTVRQVGANPILWVDGTEFRTQSGLRGKVTGNQLKTNGQAINVLMIDVGSSSNVDYGEEVEWLDPPVNALAKATVGSSAAVGTGLTGGVDDETDSQKRDRILNVRRNPPASGNWGMCKEIAESAHAGIQAAFIYCTLGGPATLKVVVAKAMSLESPFDYSREVDETIYNLARDALTAELPDGIKFVVQSVVDQPTDVAIQLALPSPATVSGTSEGWDDAIQFPTLKTDGNGVTLESYVSVTGVTSSSIITVSAMGAAPIVGQTIAWWDATNKAFTTSVIGATGGSVGAYTLTLNTALPDVAIGDFISASCANMNDYAATLLEQFNLLGPGENTSDAARLARARRKPLATSGAANFPARLGTVQTAAIINSADEITDAFLEYQSDFLPDVPAAIADAPNILTLRKLAFYPLA